jgi:threonine dehydratase
MAGGSVALRDIERAREAIARSVRHTPLIPSAALSARLGADVRLKLESLQDTGAFKIRGATNRIAALDKAERARGVVTVSTGNHGRAVAQAARRRGVKAIVCMSNLVPKNKLDAIAALGAEVRIVGRSQDEAEVEAERLVAEHGMVMVSPFDDAHVIAGQGTIGLELIGDWPEVDTVLVPVSGGGLISGIAVAVKAYRPDARVIGVSMDRGAAMVESQRAGRPVPVEELPSLADCLGGGIGLDNAFTFALVRDTVDELVLVTEAEIAQAMRHVFREERLIAEGGACVGIAALLNDRVDALGGNIAVVVSGANVDLDRFLEIVGGAEQS